MHGETRRRWAQWRWKGLQASVQEGSVFPSVACAFAALISYIGLGVGCIWEPTWSVSSPPPGTYPARVVTCLSYGKGWDPG